MANLFTQYTYSAVANVVRNRNLYHHAFVASTGDQIMPPIMGADTFLMASFLGLSYKTIMIAAILPALMYYGAVFLMVRLGAHKYHLKVLSQEEFSSKRVVAKKSFMVIPLVGIIYFLTTGATPLKAAIIGIILSLAQFVLQSEAGTGSGEEKTLIEMGLGWYKDKVVGYERDFISEPNELLALSGFFIQDTERPCHIHAVLGGRESMARGGHLFSCEVFTFLEMAVRMKDTPLSRQMVDGLPELSW